MRLGSRNSFVMAFQINHSYLTNIQIHNKMLQRNILLLIDGLVLS